MACNIKELAEDPWYWNNLRRQIFEKQSSKKSGCDLRRSAMLCKDIYVFNERISKTVRGIEEQTPQLEKVCTDWASSTAQEHYVSRTLFTALELHVSRTLFIALERYGSRNLFTVQKSTIPKPFSPCKNKPRKSSILFWTSEIWFQTD